MGRQGAYAVDRRYFKALFYSKDRSKAFTSHFFFFENLYPVCGRVAPLAKECDRPRWFFPCARCSAIRYIEGCFHAFGTAATAWPGQVVGTGFEDYFESAFWFGAAGNAPNTPNA